MVEKIDWIKAKTALDTIDFSSITICATKGCPKENECLRHFTYRFLLKNNITGHTCSLFKHEGCKNFMQIEQEVKES